MNALWLLIALAAAPARSSAPHTGPANAAEFSHPVNVNADRLEVHGQRQEAVWTGHVVADRDTTHLICDKLVAHYDDQQEITHLECLGHVQATDGNKWAAGDRADFDNVHGVLVVTGNPQARQGQNQIRGSKVTFYVGQDLLEVENAKAIFPSKETLPRSGQHPKQAPKNAADPGKATP